MRKTSVNDQFLYTRELVYVKDPINNPKSGGRGKVLAGNLYLIGPQRNYSGEHFVTLYGGLTMDCVCLIGMRRTVLIVS